MALKHLATLAALAAVLAGCSSEGGGSAPDSAKVTPQPEVNDSKLPGAGANPGSTGEVEKSAMPGGGPPSKG